jgi:acyl-CoA thioesterase
VGVEAELPTFERGQGARETSLNQRAFYAPSATHNPMRFHLPVAQDVCVGPPGRQFMMGGVGLGSAIEALEQATGRPLIWATAQYLSFAQPGSVVDIDVQIPVTGKSVTQARAMSHVGETEIITVNAALGSRSDSRCEQYAEMPAVSPPADCELYVPRYPELNDLHRRIERRRVVGDRAEHPGHSRMWMRAIDAEPMTAGLLAVFADFLAGTIPVTMASSSLDNTLRIRQLHPTRWVLLDTRISGLASGFFHGEMLIFAEDGTLLATASQSGALPRPA